MVVSTLKATRKRTGKIRSNLHTGQYAGSVSLTTARDRRWWSHWRPLGSPDTSTSFFVRPFKKGAVDLPYTPVVSIATGWKWQLLWRSWYFWHFAPSAFVARLLDLHRNVFRLNKALLFAGTKLKSTYKSFELTTATRLPTVIHHTPSKFYNVI